MEQMICCGPVRAVFAAPRTGAVPTWLGREETRPVREFHRALPGYAPTPLTALPGLARRLGVAGIYVKDESQRFGLHAFKGLGGSYALFRVVCDRLGLDPASTTLEQLKGDPRVQGLVFVTATDGNHGRGVSWAAGMLGCAAHVYLPRGSAPARARAIREAGGAQTVITDLGYDDTVRYAARMAEEHGWNLIQDTSWPGYERIPRWIAQGYSTMTFEALDQLEDLGIRPTHVILQAGVGAMAGSVLGSLVNELGPGGITAAVAEPEEAACIFRSAQLGDGVPHPARGSEVTIMAGLNCSEPCPLTWPVLRDFPQAWFSCPDEVAAGGMRLLARPVPGDPAVESGESGALPLGLARMLLSREDCGVARRHLGLGPDSVLLLFSTEGATDPEGYRAVLDGRICPEE